MRQFGLVVMVLCLWGMSTSAEAKESSCEKLQKKACAELGDSSFHCGVFQKLAKDEGASQKRCGNVLGQWTSSLASFKRTEGYIKEMEALGKTHGKRARAQVEAYKEKQRKKLLTSMLAKTKVPDYKMNTEACKQITEKVCKTLGPKAFYCGVFKMTTMMQGLKMSRCQLLLDNWETMQKDYYTNQELRLHKMRVKAKKSSRLRRRLKHLMQSEVKKLYKFLRE